MNSFLPILIRLVLVSSVAGIGYVYVAKPQNLPTPVQNVLDASTSRIDQAAALLKKNEIFNKASEKLTRPQSIAQDTSLNQTSEVKGASTTNVTQEAQNILNDAVSQVTTQAQNIPKKEAAKILRQTCEQIASDLEK